MVDSLPRLRTFAARWIFPVDGPPLPRGTITVQGETIVAVEPEGTRHPDEDLGDAAVLPGFVNAHTHLDLTGMRGLCPPTPDFPAWLRAVVRHRRQRSPEQIEQDIRTGLAECQRYGTTLIGDISSQGLSWPILDQAAVRCVVFLELLGLPPDRAEQAFQQATAWLATHDDTNVCKAGLSPHAPYSVNVGLFARLAELIRRAEPRERSEYVLRPLTRFGSPAGLIGRQVPTAIHLAESRAELELLEHRRGPLADFLRDLGVWQPDGLAASPAEIVRLFGGITYPLFVHGNYLEAAEVGPATLVYCPRTHAAFGHPPHPFRDFLARGSLVALGTDSLASNPDLNILAEARFLMSRFPDMAGETLLRMLTLNGALALGFGQATGSLTPGKSADLVVLPLSAQEEADPHQLLFASEQQVSRVMWRGTWQASRA